MSDPTGTPRDTDYPKFPALVARFGPEYVEPDDDDVHAAGDDLRDLIEAHPDDYADYGYPIPYPPRKDEDLA
jgi:hypothetical protein